MKTSVQRVFGKLTLASLPVVAAMVFVLLFAGVALGLTTISLHSAHVGANSATFNNESDDGGLADPVVWHFVLNQLDPGAPAGQLTVTFASGGTRTATGISVGAGRTQHFYVGTGGHDVLLSASVAVDSDGGKLVLSHVSWDALPPEEEEPPIEEPPVEEPPIEEPPVEEPPVEEPPVEEPPVDEELPIDEEPPVEDEDPILPLAESDEDPFLPFTGGTGWLLAMLSALMGSAGYGLRRWAVRI